MKKKKRKGEKRREKEKKRDKKPLSSLSNLILLREVIKVSKRFYSKFGWNPQPISDT